MATITYQGSNQPANNELVVKSVIQNNADLLRYKITVEEIVHISVFNKMY